MPLGLMPRRHWAKLEARFPMAPAAVMSGVVTLAAGTIVGIVGFLAYAAAQASASNDQIIDAVNRGLMQKAERLAQARPARSALVIFEFLLLTPPGLLAGYLMASGTLRFVAAWVDDPRGDPVLTAVDSTIANLLEKRRHHREHAERERREGPHVPDVLETGAWAELPGVDYVVLSSRRKPEWNAGAIVMTAEEWYRLGAPFDVETPRGMRTAYPLTRMETVEVVRRGIEYELPRLSPRARAALTPRGHGTS